MKEVENNVSNVNEKKNVVPLDKFFFDLRNFFGNNTDFRDFKKYGPISNDKNFNSNMLQFFAVYLLAEKDVTMVQLRDMYTKGDKQGIKHLTDDFIRDVTSRPVKNMDDLFDEERIMNYRWYGRLYHKAMEKAAKMGYTFADKETFNNEEALQNLVESQKQVYRYYMAFQIRPDIFKRSKGNAYTDGYKHFIEGFGGRKTYTDFTDQTVDEKTRTAHTMAEALASLVAGNALESEGVDPKVVNHYTVLNKICKGVFLAQAIIDIVQSKPSKATLENLFDPKNMNNRRGIKHYLQQRNINLFDEFVPKAPEAKPVKGKAKTK